MVQAITGNLCDFHSMPRDLLVFYSVVRRVSSVMTTRGSPHPVTLLSPCMSLVENGSHQDDLLDVDSSRSHRRNSSDPNLTLISVFTSDTAPSVQVNIQHSPISTASKATQLISLFKLNKQATGVPSTDPPKTEQPMNGIVPAVGAKARKAPAPLPKRPKSRRRDRFISFVRYVFCELVPSGSNATVAPAMDRPLTDGRKSPSPTNANHSTQNPFKVNSLPRYRLTLIFPLGHNDSQSECCSLA